MDKIPESPSPPHVLIFPFPAQGHVNSMLKLTELLLLAGLDVTFLISANDHNRLSSYTTVHSRFSIYPGFKFHVINGLYDGPMNTGDTLNLMIADSLPKVGAPLLRNLLLDAHVTCLIADGIMGFALDAARGTGVPVLFFRTVSACAFWAYFCIPKLTESGELPFEGTNMDEPILNVKGMEGFLRRRDLPNCLSDQALQQVSSITCRTHEAHALILNTFDDLEGPILSQIQKHCSSSIYTIGPLHAQLKARSLSKSASSNSLFQEDKTCIGWLDQQAPKSVLYVSFGSITTLTRDQLIEFWHGLVNSEKPFLWVIRDDLVSNTDENKVPSELEEGTKERGYIVGWAPQEDVLAHPSVCAFLTHNGWNSTLESIVEGIPMVSWPFFADQQVNSRYVEAVWKLGLDMKDTCDRKIVEKIVKEVMEVRKIEFTESALRMANLAKKSVNEGGSSYTNLNRLIEDIKMMNVRS